MSRVVMVLCLVHKCFLWGVVQLIWQMVEICVCHGLLVHGWAFKW
jgi:hypothetical protein